MLLLEANRVVPVPRLVEAAWDDNPPISASHQIRKAVAELRQRIPGGAEMILTDGPGYRASVGEDQLDLSQYRSRLRRARKAVEEGRRALAAEELRAAMELWRGPVMAGFGGSVIDAASAALEEQHLAAAEQLFSLQLSAGEASSVVGELRVLVNQHPLRETLRGQLMLALYRTGRQAEALEEYGRVRHLLAEELGIDPSGALTKLYEDILRQSPELALPEPVREPTAPPATAPSPPSAEPGPTTPSALPAPSAASMPSAASTPSAVPAPPLPAMPSAPSTLPYALRDFSGRAAEMDWIRETALDKDGVWAHIVAIDGMGGSGKTALAVQAAHQLAPYWPDSQLFVDMRGFTPGQEPLSSAAALDALLASAGVPSEELPDDPAARTALWRSITAQRRLLIVLDNAATADQVMPLIPASPDCLTIVTSRPRLVDLDGARWLSLDVLTDDDATELLARTLGREWVEREPEACAQLIRLCGRLPLAIRISAARLRNRSHWTIQRLVDRLCDETRRLDELNSTGRSVAVVLRMSYQAMDDGKRTAFRLLGLHPGRNIDPADAGALLDCHPHDAEEVLEHLLDAHLLEQHEPGWYRMHDLVRSFARGLLGTEQAAEQENQAVGRLLDHYVLTAESACDTLFPKRPRFPEFLPPGRPLHPGFATADEALQWLDRQRDSLLSAVDLAVRNGHLLHAAYLPRALGFHSHIRNYPHDLQETNRAAVAAARSLGQPVLLRISLTNLAMGQWRLGLYEESAAHLREALDVARGGDRLGEAVCMSRLGQVYNSLGKFAEALELLTGSARVQQELGQVREEAVSLGLLSSVNARLGRYQEAADAAARSLALYREIGEISNSIVSLSTLALALLGLRRPQTALERLDEALQLCDRLNKPANTALILSYCADAYVMLGRPEQALPYIERAAELAAAETTARRATVENAAGRVLRALGKFSEARDRHRNAHDLASGIAFRYETAQALHGLARAGEELGDYGSAQEHRRRADELFAEMGVPREARRLA
ncbi:AfsR/SARP family transcriptional regulator [Streptomyces neyagawaensis]|uniref:AfsR/SARP family transcriptional regulator n=3 Tax=Streptomyces neyagawaensis TaxID=42238 RepID=UPI00237DD9B0|nr:BTAD domain-containing putative transcriptional regulator [Streptomyces neyagawaensis]MDE1687638.1 BTAD domain-containing putative transcriptional regulator [Streptomyces neyagawaensis]